MDLVPTSFVARPIRVVVIGAGYVQLNLNETPL